MTRQLSIALLFLSCSPSWATTVTIELPGSDEPQTQEITYNCGTEKVNATYINTNDNQFAVLELGGNTIVMVNVISGSGAKYVGQQFEWWSKGSDATLTDVTRSSNPKECIGAS